MSIGRWRGVTGRILPIQARPARAAHAAASLAMLAGAMLAGALLAGCSSGPSLNPVEWWHGLQDGPIADVRPPPPSDGAPYPSLGSVPARPAPQDLASRGKIMSGLVADRANAQYTASQSPISTVPPPAAPPKRPSATEAATSDDTSGATLQAASAQPRAAPATASAAATPPRRAPVGKVEQATLAAPAATQPMPAIPSVPPPPPAFAGIPADTMPAPPAPKPIPVAAPSAQAPGAPVGVAFAPGSAALPPDAAGSLAQLAKTRGAAGISVTGFGEASGTDATAQSAALPLALARARTIAANLLSAGVPASAIILGAEAVGNGGVAQIAN